MRSSPSQGIESHIETVLVTGGAGFIGSHLCERLLADGYHVVALDNFDAYYDRAIKERNLRTARANPNFELIEGDIRNASLMREVLSGRHIARVAHLAGRAGVRPSIRSPELYVDVNVNGTTSLLTCAKDCGVQGVVFASSSSVYGNSSRLPWQEDDVAATPISPYAATKRAAELMCRTYHHLYGLPVSCLRFFTVYGPRQRPDMAIHNFARKIAGGEPIALFGDGTTGRDYTYVDDIVTGLSAAVRRCHELGYQIVNLGNSRVVTLRELVAVLERVLGRRAEIEWLPAQAGDVERTWADVTRAKQLFGFDPHIGIEDGIARFVHWMQNDEI